MKASHGQDGVIKFTQLMLKDNLTSVLDIGSGDRQHFKYMIKRLPNTFSNDFTKGNDYIGNFNDIVFERTFDGIHTAHVLEHQPNTNLFLKKINSILNEGGYLCITVPPLKHQIVGGHVSLWNAGLVLYHLVLAGFNCTEARIKQYGYNISVIVQKKSIKEELDLKYVGVDLKTINKYLPPDLNYKGANYSFDGNIQELNW